MLAVGDGGRSVVLADVVVVMWTAAAAICSIGHGLRTFTFTLYIEPHLIDAPMQYLRSEMADRRRRDMQHWARAAHFYYITVLSLIHI